MSIYEYSVQDAGGREVPLRSFEGKVLLIVNTATGCGFTPQYKELERLYETYGARGLEILDIPCNQFAGQAPGTDEEIHTFCTLHYNTRFPQMKKAEVNGSGALPLYGYLKSQKGFEGFGKGPKAVLMRGVLKKIDKDYENNSDIKWNFTKFLVDREGRVVARFEPTDDMDVRKFDVATPEVKISVAPENSYLLEIRVLDGRKYILIPADGGVEVNGLRVSVGQEED